MLVAGIEIDDALRRRKSKAIDEAFLAVYCCYFLAVMTFYAAFIGWASWPWPPGCLPIFLMAVTWASWWRGVAGKRRAVEILAGIHHGGSVRDMKRFQKSADAIHRRERELARKELAGRKAPEPGFVRFVIGGLSGKGWELPPLAGEAALPLDPGPSAEGREELLARTLRNARERACKTQEHVAAEADISVRTVRRAETTGRVSAENLRSLCAALGLALPAAESGIAAERPAWTCIPVAMAAAREGMVPCSLLGSLSVAVMSVLVVMPTDCQSSDWLSCRTPIAGMQLSEGVLMYLPMLWVFVGSLIYSSMVALVETLPPWKKVSVCLITAALILGGGLGTFLPQYSHLEHDGDAAAAAAIASIRSSVPTLAAGHRRAGTDTPGQTGSR